MWLESVLSKFKRILLLVSHSQDFMNGVCTNIIHMQNRKLNYYTGAPCSHLCHQCLTFELCVWLSLGVSCREWTLAREVLTEAFCCYMPWQ